MVNWRMLIGNLGGNGSNGRKASTALMPEQLRRTVDSTSLGFRTTADLVPITGLIGQDRAVEAIRFGVSIKQPDFNLFVLGPNESGKTTAVRDFLEEKARSETSPWRRYSTSSTSNSCVPVGSVPVVIGSAPIGCWKTIAPATRAPLS